MPGAKAPPLGAVMPPASFSECKVTAKTHGGKYPSWAILHTVHALASLPQTWYIALSYSSMVAPKLMVRDEG